MRRLKEREFTAAEANCQCRRPGALLSRVSSVLSVFPLSGWEPEYGGFTSYIAKGEDEEVRAPSDSSFSFLA